jgi:hypothetical protein
MNKLVELTDEEIIIRIHIDTIEIASLIAFDNNYGFENHSYYVEDKKEMLKSLYYELCREEEDGTTLVHEMLDKAVINCLEQGAEGIGGLE